MEYDILYGRAEDSWLLGYINLDWVCLVDDRKSSSSLVESKATYSSVEVKYRESRIVACKVVWLRRMLIDLQVDPVDPTTLYPDNQSVLELA